MDRANKRIVSRFAAGGRRRALWGPVTVGLALSTLAGPASSGVQETPGPSPAALDAVFGRWDREDSPGCAAGALRGGEFVFRGAYGMANLDHGVPLTADSVFRMASVSKQFTAAAVLAAEDQQLLSLEDPLRKHLPDLPSWADPVRVRHLVQHTSGVRDYLVVMALRGHGDDAHYTDDDVLAALQRLERLNFEPGSEYLYSNSGYWLLGQLVQRVSGQTLREFAKERLFEPLGMEATHFHDRRREVVPRRATGYRLRPEAEGGGFELDRTTLEMVGDGGLYTSVNQLRRWERMFLDPAALGPGFVERLVEPGRLSDGSPQDYAGGLGLGEYRGLRTVSHGGGFVGFRTYSLRFPHRDFAVFVLCNAANADPGSAARRVADLFLAAELGAPESALEPGGIERRPIQPGRFREAASASVASIERGVEGEQGLSLVRGGSGLRLHFADGELVGLSGDTRLRLLPRRDGFVLREPGQRDFHYERVEPYAPSFAETAKLTGSFHCRELDTRYEVRSDAGRGLTLAGAGRERPLEPVFLDPDGSAPVYSWEGGTVRFLRDSTGRATGFEFSAGRARGFLFTRQKEPGGNDIEAGAVVAAGDR